MAMRDPFIPFQYGERPQKISFTRKLSQIFGFGSKRKAPSTRLYDPSSFELSEPGWSETYSALHDDDVIHRSPRVLTRQSQPFAQKPQYQSSTGSNVLSTHPVLFSSNAAPQNASHYPLSDIAEEGRGPQILSSLHQITRKPVSPTSTQKMEDGSLIARFEKLSLSDPRPASSAPSTFVSSPSVLTNSPPQLPTHDTFLPNIRCAQNRTAAVSSVGSSQESTALGSLIRSKTTVFEQIPSIETERRETNPFRRSSQTASASTSAVTPRRETNPFRRSFHIESETVFPGPAMDVAYGKIQGETNRVPSGAKVAPVKIELSNVDYPQIGDSRGTDGIKRKEKHHGKTKRSRHSESSKSSSDATIPRRTHRKRSDHGSGHEKRRDKANTTKVKTDAVTAAHSTEPARNKDPGGRKRPDRLVTQWLEQLEDNNAYNPKSPVLNHSPSSEASRCREDHDLKRERRHYERRRHHKSDAGSNAKASEQSGSRTHHPKATHAAAGVKSTSTTQHDTKAKEKGNDTSNRSKAPVKPSSNPNTSKQNAPQATITPSHAATITESASKTQHDTKPKEKGNETSKRSKAPVKASSRHNTSKPDPPQATITPSHTLRSRRASQRDAALLQHLDHDEQILLGYQFYPYDLDTSNPFDDSISDPTLHHALRIAQEHSDALLAQQLQTELDSSPPSAVKARPTLHACAVCGDEHPIADLPALANCTHAPSTCGDCYAGWLESQLRDSGWRNARCPAQKCGVVLSYEEIRRYAAGAVFEQYDVFIARAALSEDVNFRWCRSCSNGQIHISGTAGNIFTCHACGHKVCVVHENTWHEGETCEEYDYRASGKKERDQKAQEEASLAMIEKSTRKCPGPGCVYNIEKNNGCDHMTCSRCKFEFCWICLVDYNKIMRESNSAHKKDCKYHTRRL